VGISASWESDPSHPIHEERMRGGHTIGPLKKWELGQQMTPEHLHELIAVERGHLRPIRLTTTTVPKGWGHELHVCNNNEFCGKELHVRAGHKFSAHFHIKKREVFRLRTGSVELTTINMEDASRLITIMNPGDVIEIPRYLPHSIKALEDSIIDEYSTMDTPGDSYRVEPGSSQTKTQCPTQSTTNPLP
jgi:mannose-6-phosphate isomerase-like protein (cupin superfamily)